MPIKYCGPPARRAGSGSAAGAGVARGGGAGPAAFGDLADLAAEAGGAADFPLRADGCEPVFWPQSSSDSAEAAIPDGSLPGAKPLKRTTLSANMLIASAGIRQARSQEAMAASEAAMGVMTSMPPIYTAERQEQ